MLERDRRRPWSYARESEDAAFPYVVRAEGESVCRVRTAVDADSICSTRSSLLREAGRRASDLRRFRVEARRMEEDIRVLMDVLDDVGQKLKLVRPRDVVRARELIRKAMMRMQNRGYLR